MRAILIDLVDHVRAFASEAETSVAFSQAVPLSEDVWDVGTGVRTGIRLYHSAVVIQAVYVLYHLWDQLGTSKPPELLPFTHGDPGTWPSSISLS